MTFLHKIWEAYFNWRHGPLELQYFFDEAGRLLETAVYDKDGRLVGWWSHGEWDGTLPYRGLV